MPISEDEFDLRQPQDPQTTMSKAELRKSHKPIMEKRRRARINNCLNEIKALILEAMNKDPARHSKLEKADILEMAVKHLQNVQRQHLALSMATDPSVLRKFKTGFNECASEIDRYVSHIDGVDSAMKQRITGHLQKCISGIEQVAHFNFPGFSNLPFLSGSNVFTGGQTSSLETPPSVGDQNNNPRIQLPQGLQLIPSRLPSGELALLLPNSSKLNYFPTTSNPSQRPSAFATVISSSATSDKLIPKPLSPPMSPPSHSEELVEQLERSSSPRGFRPVLPSKSRTSYKLGDDHQVPQVTSTSVNISQPMEVKTMKFPISKFSEKDKKLDSPRKFGEPLCIITNQSERYKQAQMKEDSANYEENIYPQGTKRSYSEMSHQYGLLTVAQQECSFQPSKILKTQAGSASSSFIKPESESTSVYKPKIQVIHVDLTKDDQVPSSSKDNSEDTNDMWRPW